MVEFTVTLEEEINHLKNMNLYFKEHINSLDQRVHYLEGKLASLTARY
jgi:hypothetical protein